jgi:formylglycine-generating enzyme required for sulfatase activity
VIRHESLSPEVVTHRKPICQNCEDFMGRCRRHGVLFGMLGVFMAGASLSGADAPPKKYALLIAVTKYDHAEMNKPQLEFPEEDAKSLGKLLEASGYKVDLLLGSQATQAAIRAKLDRLNREGSSDGVVLVAMSGHGVEVESRDDRGNLVAEGCFCPVDTVVRIVKDAKGRVIPGDNGQPLTEPDPESLVKLTELMSALKVAKASNRVVLADCCRTVPNKAKGRSFGANFKATDLPENTALLFGCSPNEQAFEHKDWGHGAFTKCLLEELRDLSASGDVTTGVLADRLKKKVPQLVASVSPRDRQTPKVFNTDTVDLQLTPSIPSLPKEIVSQSTGMKLVLIPSGTFLMGSSAADVKAAMQADANFKETDTKDEQPQHTVKISRPFYMGVYEVTQGEYEKVMGTNPSSFSKTGSSSSTVSGMDTSKFPVERVSWYDAAEFCNKLSEQDGLPAYYTLTNVTRDDGSIKSATVSVASRSASALGPSGYRLPTEAEWEYACRGGALTSTLWHTGNTLASLNEAGWWGAYATPAGNSEKRTNRVGQKAKNGFGLYDMHGNVYEWCFDVYDESAYGKRSGTTSDPVSTSGSEYRVLRGGSWDYYAMYSRSAFRFWNSPVVRNYYFGFRVVR